MEVGHLSQPGFVLKIEKVNQIMRGLRMTTANVPVRHVVAPGAMGESQPAASNESKEERAENRRVEVKVLVNKVSLAHNGHSSAAA
jgi:hypothetical protein